MWRSAAWGLGRELSFSAALVAAAMLVVHLSPWPPFWVVVTVVTAGWSARVAAEPAVWGPRYTSTTSAPSSSRTG
ncbi:hypothetical protein [Blastococcus montanus]|uniref:hypothetical protein n=1 Tax=Blastococcus montanus TaxID=3144973 RepID=UPI00320BB427